MNYSFTKGLTKGVVSAVLFAIPFFVSSFPDVANLTIGGALVIFTNYLKVKYLR